MKSTSIIILSLVIIVIILFFYFLGQLTDAFSPTYNQVELISSDNQKLYIKSKNWGVTSDHQLTIITNQQSQEFIVD